MIFRKSRRTGFTFIEIMFVVVIIGILASIVAVNTTGHVNKARIEATRRNMGTIKTALQLYEMNVGSFPTTEQGLSALIECPHGVDEALWGDEPYFTDPDLPKDGWGNDFIYKSPGNHMKSFDISSMGPDRTPDTEDDIVNWNKEKDDLDI